jgi:glycyl-tRNA synthetase beta chain
MTANTATAPLLVELGTEELPVKALPELARAFAEGIAAGLDRRGVARGAARTLYSPRRLAVLIDAVATEQPAQSSEVLGPYLNIGLDAAGEPTPALKGFAAKQGVEWTALERTTDAKGERFVARSTKPGARTAALVDEILAEALKAMPIPKPMRWGAHEHAFARPAHWLVALHGKDVLEANALGLRADRMSRGHRFHHAKGVWLSEASEYVEALRAAKVLVDPAERRARIRAEVEAAATAAGGVARIDDGILEEVNGLVEWPVAVTCGFEREFLRVPQEALISTMEANQKFFPVLDAAGALTEHFIGIANIASSDPREVRKGYERVIRPRFADARFFFDADLKQGLASMNEGLVTVTYQQKLGTLADKVGRVATLAAAIAPVAGVDADLARVAALLSKGDLQSRLVNEFPELQGIAGRYYALADAELAAFAEPDRAAIAHALDEAYQPRFAGDAIAPSPLGRVLAVAERLDTLTGGFAAGLKPTGNKDPFALRRNALGLARTLIEGGIELPLDEALRGAISLLPEAVAPHADRNTETLDLDLYDFVLDRLRGYYADAGVPAAQFEAVAAVKPASLVDFDARAKAIAAFARLPEADALAAANKRIRNILRKVDDPIAEAIDAAALVEPAERALAEALAPALADTDALLARGDYVGTLQRLAALRGPVDAFFDGVMVMADDAAVRRNRLALLKRLADRFAAVAAIEALAG